MKSVFFRVFTLAVELFTALAACVGCSSKPVESPEPARSRRSGTARRPAIKARPRNPPTPRPSPTEVLCERHLCSSSWSWWPPSPCFRCLAERGCCRRQCRHSSRRSPLSSAAKVPPTTWIPWAADKDSLPDTVMAHAQRLVGHAAGWLKTSSRRNGNQIGSSPASGSCRSGRTRPGSRRCCTTTRHANPDTNRDIRLVPLPNVAVLVECAVCARRGGELPTGAR